VSFGPSANALVPSATPFAATREPSVAVAPARVQAVPAAWLPTFDLAEAPAEPVGVGVGAGGGFAAFGPPDGQHTADVRDQALAELSDLAHQSDPAGRSSGPSRPHHAAGRAAARAGRVDHEAESLRRLLTTLTSATSNDDQKGTE
jgi:hypothetical protein